VSVTAGLLNQRQDALMLRDLRLVPGADDLVVTYRVEWSHNRIRSYFAWCCYAGCRCS
jgi:hypothetical protein